MNPPTATYASGHFLAKKAGMEGVNTEHVARVVAAASEGSKFHAHAANKQSALAADIAALQERLARLPASALQRHEAEMRAFMVDVERERDLSACAVIVDCDAFFCSVAQRDDPSLAGKPFVVGSLSMISAASYTARKFGVRSAMPGFLAQKLCPGLVFVQLDFDRYRIAAEECRVVFRRYDPHFSAWSLDEASLDFTAYVQGLAAAAASSSAGSAAQEASASTTAAAAGAAPMSVTAASASDGPAAQLTEEEAALLLALEDEEGGDGDALGEAELTQLQSLAGDDDTENASNNATEGLGNVSPLASQGGESDGDEEEECISAGSGAAAFSDDGTDDDEDGGSDSDGVLSVHEGKHGKATGPNAFAALLAGGRSGTGGGRPAPPPEQLALLTQAVAEMRAAVTTATRGLTCSAGIAANSMLAKIASDVNKPNGQCLVPFTAEGIRAFMAPLPLRRIPGIGKVSESLLAAIGYNTAGDVQQRPGLLGAAFSPRFARFVAAAALGVGGSAFGEDNDASGGSGVDIGRKSMSQERTFADCGDPAQLAARCVEAAEAVTAGLREERLRARTITVKVKLHTFEVLQRSHSLIDATASTEVVKEVALGLLKAMGPVTLRLLGVRLSGLVAAPGGVSSSSTVEGGSSSSSSSAPPSASRTRSGGSGETTIDALLRRGAAAAAKAVSGEDEEVVIESIRPRREEAAEAAPPAKRRKRGPLDAFLGTATTTTTTSSSSGSGGGAGSGTASAPLKPAATQPCVIELDDEDEDV